MKRYDAELGHAPYTGEVIIEMNECDVGDWVEASTALKLHEALRKTCLYLDTECEYNEVIMELLSEAMDAMGEADA